MKVFLSIVVLQLATAAGAAQAVAAQSGNAGTQVGDHPTIKRNTSTEGKKARDKIAPGYSQEQKDKELAASAAHTEYIARSIANCEGREPCTSMMNRALQASKQNHERIEHLKTSAPRR